MGRLNVASFLLPLSCIVVPIGNLANKQFSSFLNFSSFTTSNSQTFTLPTVFPSNNMGMDLLSGPVPDNYNKVRGRNLSTNRSIFRNSSMSSTIFSAVYHERMVNNDMDIDKGPVESTSALSYETE